MKFATALFALVPLVTALPPAVRTVEAEVRNATALATFEYAPIDTVVCLTVSFSFVCVDAGFQNSCATFHGSSGQCVNFPPNLNDVISSFGPDSGQDCFIFVGPQNGPIRNPGIPNLAIIGFNDAISSFKCFFG
ncbi:hypothetical protein C8J57DRAFT_1514853 [Mycena rebaudengoi]|nr:hypothetical protein C8J57DRAFT_1514853 [Mycena rebaudengoi]